MTAHHTVDPSSWAGVHSHLTVARATVESAFPSAQEWDDLTDRLGAPPFLRPGWVMAWWRAFRRGNLEILVLRRKGRLAGLLPVYRRYGSLTSLTNWHTPQWGVLAEDSSAAGELAQTLFSSRHRSISLWFFDAQSAEKEHCRGTAEAAGDRVIIRTVERSPYVTVEADWSAYEKLLDAKVMRDLRRRRRRLEGEGEVSLEVADGSDRLDDLLAEGFRLEPSGWKQGTAIHSSPNTRHFYTDVARWAAEEGLLRLAFLRLGERAVAFQYGLEQDNIYYLLKSGYDPDYRRYAPGKLLVQAMLLRAFDSGLATFEFLGNAEPWKLQWTNSIRERQVLQAFAPSAGGLAEWAVHTYGRTLARRLHLRRALALFGR